MMVARLQIILDSVSQAYLTETLTQQSFWVAMLFHLARLEEKRCSKVLAKFTHEPKRSLRVNTSTAAPVRQSALRSHTSPLTSVLLLEAWQQNANGSKRDTYWHIFFFRLAPSLYRVICVCRAQAYIRNHTQRTELPRTPNVLRLHRGEWACLDVDDWRAVWPNIPAVPAHRWD